MNDWYRADLAWIHDVGFSDYALQPGGVFVFAIGVPGQVEPGTIVKGFTEGADWVVLVEKAEELSPPILTRRSSPFVNWERITGEMKNVIVNGSILRLKF
jgi:hypothetical protein